MQSDIQVSAAEIETAIDKLATEIADCHGTNTNLIVAGIANGGIPFATRLATALAGILGHPIPCGTLAVAFHRDDILTKPIPKKSPPTELPAEINDATVILADDVLGSGRTVRAALGELFDLGRPARVTLAVLFDRNDTRLPIRADFYGFRQKVPADQQVLVSLSSTASASDSISTRSQSSQS